MTFRFGNQNTFPISNFSDKKVTLEQELGERTVAFRDKNPAERNYLINIHKNQYRIRKYLPFIMPVFLPFEFFLIYLTIEFFKVEDDLSQFTLFIAIVLPLLLYGLLRRENNLYKDIGRPVVKTVGTLKTYKKIHRNPKGNRVEKYFEVENIRFDNNNNDNNLVEKVLEIFGENKIHHPIRIEYSPFSKTVWNVKKRTADNSLWEVAYNRLS